MIKLNQLENALALAAHGNFHRAAAAQNISQPALSRSIQKLEESMGVILFDRDPEKVVPTDFGKTLLSRSKSIIGETEEMQREIQMLQGLGTGHVSISMGVYPAELSGGHAIGELIRLHPHVSVKSYVHEWRFIIQQVLERSIDLGIAEISTLKDSDSKLEFEPLGQHEAVFFCRKGHPLAGQKNVSKKDLDVFPLAAVNLPPRVLKLFPGMTHVSKHTGDLVPSVEVNSLAMANSTVESSDAIGVSTPIQIEPLLKSGLIEILPFRRKWLKLRYGFICLRNHRLSPAAKLFMELTRNIEKQLARRNKELMRQMFPGT